MESATLFSWDGSSLSDVLTSDKCPSNSFCSSSWISETNEGMSATLSSLDVVILRDDVFNSFVLFTSSCCYVEGVISDGKNTWVL